MRPTIGHGDDQDATAPRTLRKIGGDAHSARSENRLTMRRLYFLLCLFALVAGCSASSPPAPEDFPTFWHAFRTAALGDQVDQVASMTRFPLEVRGPDQRDSARYSDFALAAYSIEGFRWPA
jgi:hypothetical protein